MKPWIPITAAAVIANVAFTMIGRGSFLHVTLVALMTVGLGLPVLVVGAAAYHYHHESPAWARTFRWSRAAAIIIASCVLSWPLGSLLAGRDIARAETYCEVLIPKLEAYRSAHGFYPREVTAVADPSHLPRLLKGSPFYASDGLSYSFSIEDSRGVLTRTLSYSSDAERTWAYNAD